MSLRALATALLVIFVGALAASPLRAQEKEEPKRRKTYLLTPIAAKKLFAAMEFMQEEEYDEAKEELDSLARRKLNPLEEAQLHQTYAFIHGVQDDYEGAVSRLEKAVALDALPEASHRQSLYQLGQLYMAVERFKDSVATMEKWIAGEEDPPASAYYVLAGGYMQLGKFKDALTPAKKAVELGDPPKEAWLQMLLMLHFERGDIAAIEKLLERTVALYPKKAYFIQLAAVYAETGKEEKSLGVMQIAYEQGMLTTDSQLRRLAQSYLYHEIPYRAALVMENALEEEKIEADQDAYELLANSWISAREYDKAVPPLEKAAELADDGELYVRLSQVHIERYQWAAAAKALELGLAKRGIDHVGDALILLGLARYSIKSYDSAEKAFDAARRHEDTRASAVEWLRHLKVERDREAVGERVLKQAANQPG